MVVASTGTYYNLGKSTTPKMNESIPVVSLTSTSKDKKVVGVVSGKEPITNTRKYKQGNFRSALQKKR